MDAQNDSKKPHRERKAGRKADKKKEKDKHVQELTPQQRNPKAFAVNSAIKTQRRVARTADIKSRKHHIPVVNRTPLEPPPVVVAVVGGSKVGKTTLVRSLIKNYTKQKLSTIDGPVTVVAGKKKRLTFIEVKNDINCYVDIAKVADVVLMLIDITLGIEMELLEFLEVCRAFGMPRVMGVLNHLDLMKMNKNLRMKKKLIIRRFQVELYPGAKVFSLSGLLHGDYMKKEIQNLGRFISILKFRPMQFRLTHPYVLVDRIEDITNTETVRLNPTCPRNVVLYGYVRGIPLNPDQSVHIPGVGDFRMKKVTILDDPCPLPDAMKKRSLNFKEKLIYAPLSGVAGVVYDKDAIYIDLGGSHHGRAAAKQGNDEEIEESGENVMMKSLLQMQKTADEKTAQSQFRLFSNSQPMTTVEGDAEEGTDEEDEDFDKSEETSKAPQFEALSDGEGGMRRRVIFEDDDNDDESGIESDESDSNESDGDADIGDDYLEDSHPRKKLKKDHPEEECELPGVAEDTVSPSEGEPRPDLSQMCLPGFEKLHTVSAKSYISFLQNSIYGEVESTGSDEESESDSDNEDLFRRVKTAVGGRSRLPAGADLNGLDCTKRLPNFKKNWNVDELKESIRDCFVTGEWGEMESAEKLLKLDEETEDLYGDFEDLETGEKTDGKDEEASTQNEEGSNDKTLDKGEAVKKKSEMTAKERRIEKKRKLKEFFDSEYDDRGGEDNFDALKAEMNEQAELNRNQFAGLDDESRVKYEGFRAGVYVRMEFEEMDREIITNFDPSYPLIVGGLLDTEMTMAFINVRLKVHRWFPRILKNKDPLYLSLGWRRFQSIVYYAKKDDNFRLRSIKYARKYVHVEATFWGPVTDISSGFIAIQNINERTPAFSIAANGVVLETDQTTKLVKKLKLVGHPEKIYRKTAMIKNMFHSDTELVKFEGVKIRTQSSIRGVIKKAVGHDGVFRATFEDVIKASDTVFLTTWAPVDVPKYSILVKNLLLEDKLNWSGMKTLGQIKRERNIKVKPNPNSLYTEITERRDYVPRPLKIPKKLQEKLPYKDKPKIKPNVKNPERVVVVRDPEEVKMQTFMNRLKAVMQEKSRQERLKKKQQTKEFKKKLKEKEEIKQMREKKRKAHSCKMFSLRKKKN